MVGYTPQLVNHLIQSKLRCKHKHSLWVQELHICLRLVMSSIKKEQLDSIGDGHQLQLGPCTIDRFNSLSMKLVSLSGSIIRQCCRRFPELLGFNIASQLLHSLRHHVELLLNAHLSMPKSRDRLGRPGKLITYSRAQNVITQEPPY